MATKVQLQIQSLPASNTGVSTRNYGNITTGYVGETGGTRPALPYYNGTQYNNFWEWADAVARGVNALSTDTYSDCLVVSTFDVNEELAE